MEKAGLSMRHGIIGLRWEHLHGLDYRSQQTYSRRPFFLSIEDLYTSSRRRISESFDGVVGYHDRLTGPKPERGRSRDRSPIEV